MRVAQPTVDRRRCAEVNCEASLASAHISLDGVEPLVIHVDAIVSCRDGARTHATIAARRSFQLRRY